ncbi:MAG: sulfite exporter TauE/SafE family protein [Ignavibacteriota bacterium]|nr:sulfite exporter TauE/SafE family protein [Ignavibacteriota bacterium]MCO6448808.1 sulfite exporter TauE/SafE family protein [Ignavibacterium album]MCZ2269565.1 sulfite exporter TauE/SafE family protein [Ignavibacteriales bacterium]QKJ99615.1 MAG: sulfite exporter TauE/SafE family protein [Ignavibacteriota bacterium]HOJ06077.1 sulfite exporter TauE/SafE family protein [Ignavibacteriaceae bacterium]
MPDLQGILILFFVGAIAAFINVNAGGGSSLTLPVLIFLGLDPSVANGTNRVAILFQNASAVYAFKKEKFYELKNSLILSALTLPGAIIGAVTAVSISDELFEKILGVIMIFIIITMILPKKKTEKTKSDFTIDWKIVAAMIVIGFYGAFLQVGVGLLLMASLQYLMKLDLIRVNMHKVFVVFVFTLPALLVFILTDNINWFYGVTLSAGNAFGGWWGAKLSVKKGEKLIKFVLIIAILIMALKLLNVY